jgi:hypothetical protein
MSRDFFATPSERLDIYLETMVAARPDQPGDPPRLFHRAVRRQEIRLVPVHQRSTRAWLWRHTFGHLAGRERRN